MRDRNLNIADAALLGLKNTDLVVLGVRSSEAAIRGKIAWKGIKTLNQTLSISLCDNC